MNQFYRLAHFLFKYIKKKVKIIEIKTITINSKEYPYLLKHIPNKPNKLYVLGNLENLNKKGVTIVGSRQCTKYGRNIGNKLGYMLSKRGYVIVSGLAIGIDTSAHIGALKAKGRTIAVLAHGLNHIYPKQNKKLAIEILKHNGTIISEYPINAQIKRENFVNRNRIMSGLTEKTIVVEAEEKSGSLVTANLALEQGRDVYAVLGDITSKTSMGTNKLIQEGAKIIIL